MVIDARARAISHIQVPLLRLAWFRTSTTGPFNFVTVDRPCLQSLCSNMVALIVNLGRAGCVARCAIHGCDVTSGRLVT